MPSGSRILTLHLHSEQSSKSVAIAVAGDGGVDLGQVGRAVGLDPSTVRLNGYFLSRGRCHVSDVTWRALLSFFLARGLPTGADAAASPLAVNGKPCPPGLQISSSLDAGNLLCSKRKFGQEDENCVKKNKPAESRLTVWEPGDRELSDEITLGMKRRLKLEDSNPVKKTKPAECNSDSANEASAPVSVKCSYSFINGHGKRPREGEMVATVSCKRAR